MASLRLSRTGLAIQRKPRGGLPVSHRIATLADHGQFIEQRLDAVRLGTAGPGQSRLPDQGMDILNAIGRQDRLADGRTEQRCPPAGPPDGSDDFLLSI